MSNEKSLFGKEDLIFSYTRKEAIRDGLQIEIDSNISNESGIKYPVFFTQKVWGRYVEFVPENVAQDENGRLLDILCMFREAVRVQNPDSPIMNFIFLCQFHKSQTWLPNEKRTKFSTIHREVSLRSEIGAKDIDDPSPAITIMMLDED